MQDQEIIQLYLQRDEQAIWETVRKYGAYCRTIAENILENHEDAEECLNDPWNSAWNRIPPLIPLSLKAFLGKLIRDRALSRYRENHAARRYGGVTVLLSELDECIPDRSNVEQEAEMRWLSRLISEWLRTCKEEDSALFLKRYYFGVPVQKLADEFHINENTAAQKLRRMRMRLKDYLNKEGADL